MALKFKTTPAPRSTSPAVEDAEAIALASEYQALANELARVKAELALAREALLSHAGQVRADCLRAGSVSNVRFPTDEGRVLVVYQEKYKGLPAENTAMLRDAFGESFALYCEEVEAATLKRGATTAQLTACIGEGGVRLLMDAGLVKVKAEVKPRKGAPGHIASLYSEGNHDAAEALESFVEATIYAPQVRAK